MVRHGAQQAHSTDLVLPKVRAVAVAIDGPCDRGHDTQGLGNRGELRKRQSHVEQEGLQRRRCLVGGCASCRAELLGYRKPGWRVEGCPADEIQPAGSPVSYGAGMM